MCSSFLIHRAHFNTKIDTYEMTIFTLYLLRNIAVSMEGCRVVNFEATISKHDGVGSEFSSI